VLNFETQNSLLTVLMGHINVDEVRIMVWKGDGSTENPKMNSSSLSSLTLLYKHVNVPTYGLLTNG